MYQAPALVPAGTATCKSLEGLCPDPQARGAPLPPLPMICIWILLPCACKRKDWCPGFLPTPACSEEGKTVTAEVAEVPWAQVVPQAPSPTWERQRGANAAVP